MNISDEKETICEVFMVESLTFENERDDKFEGRIITSILKLNGKNPLYYYIRTKKELISILEEFDKTQYRYLHISCHADKKAMQTTLDTIPFEDLASILKPHLRGKRLFISACEMVNDRLAKLTLPDSSCFSILGPCKTVAFSDAAILWSSFYHLMFNHDSTKMKGNVLRDYAKKISNLYRVPLNYFRWDAFYEEMEKLRIRPIKTLKKTRY